MKFADLHVHSYFSDGSFSPEFLVDQAVRAGLAALAITDHDTTQALDISVAYAAGRIELLTGIELSTDWGGQEVHILGYCFDHNNEDLQSRLKHLKEQRRKRVYAICAKLQKLNVSVEPEDVFQLAGQGVVGRLHIARLLCEKGFVGTTQEAFRRYLSDRGPAYVSGFKMTPLQAIELILKTGGVPVLAHPYNLREGVLISDFVKWGIRGIEVYYSKHSSYQTREFVKIAQKYDLLMTGGSDYHGDTKKDIKLGSVKVPYACVEKLREMACR